MRSGEDVKGELADLREAVQRVTKPVQRAVWQGTGHDHEWRRVTDARTGEDVGGWACHWCGEETVQLDHPPVGMKVVRRTDPPLLDQLEAAVAGDLGQKGGAKPQRERTPIDIAALGLVETIDGRVRAWHRDVGSRPGNGISLRQLLDSWFVLWQAGSHADGLSARHTSIVASWESRIEDCIAPPKRIEITAPCPVCGQEFANVGLKLPNGDDDPNDIEMVRVLTAVERESLEDSYALCSACSTVWKGVGQMRQLRILLDDVVRHADDAVGDGGV